MKKTFRISILFLLFAWLPTSALAQAELGLMAVGGNLGISNPEGPLGNAILFEGAAHLGTVAENLNLDARLGYWSKSEGAASLRDFSIGAAVSFALGESDAQVQPFVGGGLSLHFLKVESEIDLGDLFGRTSASATSTELGIDLRGGAKYGMNEQVDLVGEAIYTLGDAEQLAFKIGALFKLGQ